MANEIALLFLFYRFILISISCLAIAVASATDQKDSLLQAEKVLLDLEKSKTLYERHCIICHDSGLAGAPRFRNSSDWKGRENDDIKDLTAAALKGKNAMPVKGTCTECSEADLKEIIQYMLPTDKQNA